MKLEAEEARKKETHRGGFTHRDRKERKRESRAETQREESRNTERREQNPKPADKYRA